MKAKYVNPFTDFGFKKLFGEEASKPLLLDFLNSLLPEEVEIKDLSFKNTEQLGRVQHDRKAVYDIYCETEEGEKVIVELQKLKHNYFKDRTVYYSTFPIQEQALRGDWNYKLKAVYCIGILDFVFSDRYNVENEKDVIQRVKFKNQKGQIYYDKLTFIQLEMPNFNKTEAELETRLDKWLYFIKHLEDFDAIPSLFQDAIFEQAFTTAALSKMNEEERLEYNLNLKIYRDNKSAFETAREDGISEGRRVGKEEGILEGMKEGQYLIMSQIVMHLTSSGKSMNEIQELTDFDLSVIQQILNEEK